MSIVQPNLTRAILIAALTASLVSCDEGKRYDQALCVLIDVSGTYADQREEVVRILKSEVLPSIDRPAKCAHRASNPPCSS